MNQKQRVLLGLGAGLLLLVNAVSADSEIYLLYPESWCQEEPGERLHFTTSELGITEVFGFTDPSHGRVFLDPAPADGGFYLPQCEGLLHPGFDFFQLSGPSGNLINVTVLLDDGEPELHQVAETATAGGLGDPWSLVWEDGDPTTGVQLIEWPPGETLDGTHGFRVEPGQQADSYLTFSFDEPSNAFQPPARRGGGNSGVETIIIIRPPSDPPSSDHGGGLHEQIIYATGLFDGASPPGTALRLRIEAEGSSIRAEAATPSGTVETLWCPLSTGTANEVYVHHAQGLNGDDDSLTLRIGPEGSASCENFLDGFVSLHPPAPEHRFGTMAAPPGGLAFDFDRLEINSVRFKPGLESDLMDDFETGSWGPRWVPVNPVTLNVNPGAAHTGLFGLEVLPSRATSSYLEHSFPIPESDLACHLGLDADFISTLSPAPKILVFAARGSSADQMRLWLRQSGSAYQLRAHSGSVASPWLPLNRLPATVDFRWTSGLLELWIQGCGPDGSSCGTGHLLASNTWIPINTVRLGAISVPQQTQGAVTVDNVLCLKKPAPSQ